MVCAEAAFEALQKDSAAPLELKEYPDRLRASWVYDELYKVRNIHPSFSYGLLPGLAYSAFDTYVMWGKAPWTFHHRQADHEALKPAKECKPIDYPKPDGKISFDLLTALAASGTNHNENQPAHLKLRDPKLAVEVNYKVYDSPETRYCPAGVYEIVKSADGTPRLQINAQNCLHCKTCDIKDPRQNIDYTTPEGGGGPAYPNM
jgi:electron-transferring-flavoprotein dehydrogenase